MRGLLVVAAGLVALVAVCRADVKPEAEKREEKHDEQQEVDDGVCVPLKCEPGSPPPAQCTRLCAMKKWLPVCMEGSNDCICHGPDGQQMSPDEIEPQDEDKAEPYTFTVLTIFFPDSFWSEADPDVEPTATSQLFESVNVHEGRLLWDFRYVLGGLLALMMGLVAYELVLCRKQNAKAKLQMDPFDLYGVEKPLANKEMPMVI